MTSLILPKEIHTNKTLELMMSYNNSQYVKNMNLEDS